MARLLLPGLQKNLQDRKDKYCIMTEKGGNINKMEDGDYIILNLQQFDACHETMHEVDELQSTAALVEYVYSKVRDIYFIISQNPSMTLTPTQHAAAMTKCIAFLKGMQVSNRFFSRAFRRHPQKLGSKSHKQNPHLLSWMELKEQVANNHLLSSHAQAQLFAKLYRTFSFMLSELLIREHNEGKEITTHPLDKASVKWLKQVEVYYTKFLIPHKNGLNVKLASENKSNEPAQVKQANEPKLNTTDHQSKKQEDEMKEIRRDRNQSPTRQRFAEKRRREDSRDERYHKRSRTNY